MGDMLQLAYQSVVDRVKASCQELFGGKRLILASNRGPVEYRCKEGGRVEPHRGSGGVVTALSTLTKFAKVNWVATAITDGDRIAAARFDNRTLSASDASEDNLRLRLLTMPPNVYEKYYGLFSNTLLWFLQHELWDELDLTQAQSGLEEGWSEGYLTANLQFADAILDELSAADTGPYVMLHDYHLYVAPRFIRDRAPGATLSHFIHIPFPEPSAWQALPVPIVQSIFQGLLANDLMGFQTIDSALNFLLTCQDFIPDTNIDFRDLSVCYGGRETKVRTYPVSVDVEDLRMRMISSEVQDYRKRLQPLLCDYNIVRVDRIDPSKNIICGLEALNLLLERHPWLVGRVKLLCFLVPSRTSITQYRDYTEKVFQSVNLINECHRTDTWRPVEVFYENNYSQALAGMSLYDVLLVNPIADGMNLVAKEGPIVNGRNGVLILSRKAGAHLELGEHALSINPLDIEGTAAAIWQALFMSPSQKRLRSLGLRTRIESTDIDAWFLAQLEDLLAMSQETGLAA